MKHKSQKKSEQMIVFFVKFQKQVFHHENYVNTSQSSNMRAAKVAYDFHSLRGVLWRYPYNKVSCRENNNAKGTVYFLPARYFTRTLQSWLVRKYGSRLKLQKVKAK